MFPKIKTFFALLWIVVLKNNENINTKKPFAKANGFFVF